jgi:hypothetical protein
VTVRVLEANVNGVVVNLGLADDVLLAHAPLVQTKP